MKTEILGNTNKDVLKTLGLGGINAVPFLWMLICGFTRAQGLFFHKASGFYMLKEREYQGYETDLYQVRKAVHVQNEKFTEGS